MDELVLPAIERFRPEAVVVTCGADALEGDPLARMALSNAALWDAVDSLVALAPAAVVLTLVLVPGLLAGEMALVPRTVAALGPEAARAVLAHLTCDLVDDEDMRPEWLTTLADAPKSAAVRPALYALHAAARARATEGAAA